MLQQLVGLLRLGELIQPAQQLPFFQPGIKDEVVARIVETPRNGPVRNLYRDGGFSPQADGSWRRVLRDRRAA